MNNALPTTPAAFSAPLTSELSVEIRRATLNDVGAMLVIERTVFETDRMSRRSMRHQVESETSCFLVATVGADIAGYAIFFMHRGTSLARLYSIATAPSYQGRGIAKKLLEHGEEIATENGRIYMRLEVREDNVAAIRLYEKMGYRQFGEYEDYYEDHTDALRYEKRIFHYDGSPTLRLVPYFSQNTGFTCGSAALMMAMNCLSENYNLNPREELQIWREATTIYMTSGHGGCGPYGLALAAKRRGFRPVIYVNQEGPLFLDSVRTADKKAVMTMVHEDFSDQTKKAGIEVHKTDISQDELREHIANGGVPIILISTYRMWKKKAPHWVVVTAFDQRFFYINDPELDLESGTLPIDLQYLPISTAAFSKITHFGQSRLRTAVIIYKD
ncbi:GCN5-related N-acetyltransferase [gamma proteobacterium HdN1]|nr:GCN5-related N-acetyltransferase [gamma proteobacterium HdN1]